MQTGYKSVVAYRNVEEMLGAIREKVLLRETKGLRLQNESSPSIALEHRLIDRISQV
jgi:hypothetical protein